jgi:hypothetical protein
MLRYYSKVAAVKINDLLIGPGQMREEGGVYSFDHITYFITRSPVERDAQRVVTFDF